jgi:hypothetical protein
LEEKDTAAVRAVLERYVDATFRADLEGLRSTFHPEAFMAGYLGDALIVGSPESFFADIGSRPAMATTGAPYEADIADIHVAGRVASARVEESGFFGQTGFINYFHLLDVGGGWKIVSKTFQTV